MVQQVKDMALSLQWLQLLLWHGFNPWPRNWHSQKKRVILINSSSSSKWEEKIFMSSYETDNLGQMVGQ